MIITNLPSGANLDPTTATADKILTGYTAYNGDREIMTGTIPETAAATYNTSASDQTIGSGQYLSGVQIIKGVTTSNISAANIKKGVTINVGDANNTSRITSVTGTFTSDANATAAQILANQTAYVNGSKITGTMTNRGSWTGLTTGSGNVTIPAGYHSGSGYISGAGAYSAGVSATKKGTATAAQVLSGYTFTNASSVNASGSMTNRGAVSSALNCGGSYTIPAGYHNGSGKVTANSLASQTSATATAADILKRRARNPIPFRGWDESRIYKKGGYKE